MHSNRYMLAMAEHSIPEQQKARNKVTGVGSNKMKYRKNSS